MPDPIPGQTPSLGKNRLSRRDFLRISAFGLTSLALAACLPSSNAQPTPEIITEYIDDNKPDPISTQQAPADTQTAKTTHQATETLATAVPTAITIYEGQTIEGQTLSMGGNTLELKSMDAEGLAKIVSAQDNKWKIVKNKDGQVSTFMGFVPENGIQVAVLAQGAPNFDWDKVNSIWVNKKTSEVSVPDVILPGGWNEENKTAGPIASADIAFLFKDEKENYKVGVLYSPETMQKLPPSTPDIKKLANGYGLFTGEPKNRILQPGQKVLRTADNNLRLTNSDGSYLEMITYWGNVTSPDQLYQVGDFAGPTELNPKVSYPLEAKTKKLNYEIRSNLNDPNKSRIVFARDTSTKDVVLATRLDKHTGEYMWNKIGLRDFGDAEGILLGSEFRTELGKLYDNRNGQLYLNQLNFATMEGVSWSEIEPQQDYFDFNKMDTQLNEWIAQGLTIRGQGLLSAWDDIYWLKNSKISRDEAIKILNNHVKSVVSHGKGKVQEWVVVGEPYLAGHPQRSQDIYYKLIGPDYIDIAFQAAREADPSAKLIYNDTDNHSANGLTTQLTRTAINRLKNKGLVDMVGIESHIGDWVPIPNKSDVKATLKSYELPVAITEFDYNLKGVSGDETQRFQKQAKVYGDFFSAALESGVCREFSFWGINDGGSWLTDTPGASPAMFDSNNVPKPAYFAILNILQQRFNNVH